MRFAPKLTYGFAALCTATAVAAGAIEQARERDYHSSLLLSGRPVGLLRLFGA
jgi:hypothetical protein